MADTPEPLSEHDKVRFPTDHRPKADDGIRPMHAEQMVDKVLERAGGGVGVVTFIGTMLGQLGEAVTAHNLAIDWESLVIYANRTEVAGVEASTHNIVPKGTLVLILDVKVKVKR